MTFGFLHVKSAIPRGLINTLNQDWEHIFSEVYQTPYNKIRQSTTTRVLYPVQRFVPQIVCILKDYGLFDTVVKILGPNCAFFNQDMSLFFQGSGWHRDVATIMPQLKVAIYLNDRHPDGNGDFMFWPGTHMVGDIYSQYAGEYCPWPVLGAGIKADLLPNNVGIVPHCSAMISPGDAIIFDDRLVHCTAPGNAPSVPAERRLFSTVFFANPQDFPDSYFLARGTSRDAATAEVIAHMAECEVLKNGPTYPAEFFTDPELNFLQPHLALLSPPAKILGRL